MIVREEITEMVTDMKKQTITAICILTILAQGFVTAYGAIDGTILSETITNTYLAKEVGVSVIDNIRFTDIAANNWAKEPVSRLGALDIVKGYNNAYSPSGRVTKEEALAMLIRLIGREQDAVLAAENMAANAEGETVTESWSKGYMQIANQMGLITAADYRDSIQEDQQALEETAFRKQSTVSREQLAKWLVQAVSTINPEQLQPEYTQQAIFQYTDWRNMGAEFTPYIEVLSRKKIMVGSGGTFLPKSSLTRAELAQVIKNMDSVLYQSMNIEQKAGVVGAILEDTVNNPLSGTAKKNFLVRNNTGNVDKLVYEYNRNTANQVSTKDAPVFQYGQIRGMQSLEEGDEIEYLVDKDTNEILYIKNNGTTVPKSVTGILQPINSLEEGLISVKTTTGAVFSYPLRDGLFDLTQQVIVIGKDTIKLENAPVNSKVTLTIKNNIVVNIEHIGNNTVYSEVSGIVKENNPEFSYITIIDWNGNEVTKSYQKSSLLVEKQNYYDESDEIGYIDEMFPEYSFDGRDAFAEDIEAGDIVHMRIDTQNRDYVTMISAKTNYIARHGTIRDIAYKGAEGASVVVVNDDGSVGSFNLESTTPILKGGKNVGILNLIAGDSVRMLINQAVLQPGTLKETVKEMVIDVQTSNYANVYKGQLGIINNTQQTLSIYNTYNLSNTGWSNYQAAKSLDISGRDIEYYQDGKRISLDYAAKYLTNEDTEAYIVTSDYYGAEKVEKVTFRSGRDSVLSPSNITYSNGIDKLALLTQGGTIGMDLGTIVIKNGKILQAGNVVAPDYAQIVLNGGAKAAIINIKAEPNNDAVSVFRGRIQSVEDGQSFQVQSHAVLLAMEWIYSPIPRIFEIDYNTRVITEEGVIGLGQFIDYSELSKVDEVYTIIAEGTKASYIVQNPYAKEGVKGEIYTSDNGKAMIKDVTVYSSEDKKWSLLSLTNSYAEILFEENTVILKNNKVISPSELEKGDVIRVMTTEDLAEKLMLTQDRTVSGAIVFVEK